MSPAQAEANLAKAEPNPGHRALVALEQRLEAVRAIGQAHREDQHSIRRDAAGLFGERRERDRDADQPLAGDGVASATFRFAGKRGDAERRPGTQERSAQARFIEASPHLVLGPG